MLLYHLIWGPCSLTKSKRCGNGGFTGGVELEIVMVVGGTAGELNQGDVNGEKERR